MPNKKFWRSLLEKALSFLVSLKIYILGLATYLLWIGKIDASTWSTVIIAVALGRVVVQGVIAASTKQPPKAAEYEHREEIY